MNVSETKKQEYWNHYTSSACKGYRPFGVTDKRLERIKTAVFANNGLWEDVIARHGGLTIQPTQMDSFTFEHSIGNFFGMITEIMFRMGVLK